MTEDQEHELNIKAAFFTTLFAKGWRPKNAWEEKQVTLPLFESEEDARRFVLFMIEQIEESQKQSHQQLMLNLDDIQHCLEPIEEPNNNKGENEDE